LSPACQQQVKFLLNSAQGERIVFTPILSSTNGSARHAKVQQAAGLSLLLSWLELQTLNTVGRHHSRDLAILDLQLGTPCGSRDGIRRDSRPENPQQDPSTTDNREWLVAKLSH
jgi:hypothetical protein